MTGGGGIPDRRDRDTVVNAKVESAVRTGVAVSVFQDV
jgi:hypothetical protein